ncbi:capsular polysaccharide export protein, LipB/KpsS family [Acinetobacter indicus]|uniref:Capsule polysaccharide biosynthesis protein n=1 Tax=Acinetobacter indicus CIP 110367 TaxID=1341679 RepID=V2UAU1_9GAMM|nr:hypothetical protein [Acinetobacter indicus]EPF73675.1 hypothetical protein F956_00834 [Acinetobacter indicus ANC 4215]ESK47587.1 hypothetical protein P253_02202 [Acinetobacter indicus CIP 110367]
MNKFIFEYPKDWVKMADSQNIAFLNNINLCLIELNQLVSSIPVGYPSYGIARPHTEGPYLSFHSYNNPEGVWSYKEAPIKGLYSIDPKGYGGWSDIAKNPAKYQHEINNIANYDEILQPFINQLKQGISKYKQSKTKLTFEGDFILFALQVRTDSVADHAYLDVVDVIERISELAIQYKKRVVIKLHPKCDSELLKSLVFKLSYNNKWIFISNGDITQLIQMSKCVLACNSGVSLESLLLNKKVYCFGESEWFSITNKIKALDQVEDIFVNYDLDYNLSIYQKKYLAFLLSKYWVGYNGKAEIKRKLEVIIDENKFIKQNIDIEEESILNILNAQEDYMKRVKRVVLIERDFEGQKNLLKHLRSNPFYLIFYFMKFNFLKLKGKLNI